MKILAIEKAVPGVNWSHISPEFMKQEALDVYSLYLSEQLREHYFNEDRCAVLVLECDSKAKAQALLEELPLVKHNLIAFEIMELRPYSGYDRIMHTGMQP